MRCELNIVSIEILPLQYVALSYCWGEDLRPVDKLWCNDQTYFNLTPTLSLALGWLTSLPTSEELYIWIDYLCIDQRNNTEKGIQVAMMGEIYSGAKLVLAWVIGDLNMEQHTALMFLQTASTEIQKLRESGTAITYQTLESIPTFKNGSREFTALAKFLTLPYWQRMWIIQEIVMARQVTIVCGGLPFEWEPFAMCLEILLHNVPRYLSLRRPDGAGQMPPGLRAITYIDGLRISRRENRQLPLALSLLLCQRFNSSKACDKIYGTLGMITDPIPPTLRPDYDAPVHEVYTAWTRHLLISGESLVLQVSGIGWKRTIPGLPTWVPDWSSVPTREAFGIGNTEKNGFLAAGPSSLLVRQGTCSNSIILQARFIGTVSKILPPDPLMTSAHNRAEQLVELCKLISWLAEIRHAIFLYTKYKDKDDAYWRVLIANMMEMGAAAAPEFLICFHHFLKFKFTEIAVSIGRGDIVQEVGTADETARGQLRFLEALGSVAETRVFVTGEEYVGRSQPGLMRGDEVWIVEGAKTPFVLREYHYTGKRMKTRTVVGDCYVHGLMKGEGMGLAAVEDVELY